MKYIIIFWLIIVVGFSIMGCYDEDSFSDIKFDFDDLITELSIEKHEIIANGVDKSDIKIYFDSLQDTENLNLEATISNGIFLENGKDSITLKPSVQVEGSLRKFVKVSIRPTLEQKEILLTLNINNHLKRITFYSIRNYPSEIQINPNPIVFQRKRIENINLTIDLVAEVGLVSNNTKMILTAKDSLENDVGTIFSTCSNFKSSPSCIAQYNIWPDTSYVGPITIKALVPANQDSIINSINIYSTN